MTIQVIINSAQQIEFDRRKIVGQTISRSQRVRTAERNSSQAFTMRVTPLARWKFKENRFVLESIMKADRIEETQINIAANPNLGYITEYTGELTAGQLSAMTISTFTSATITFSSLPSVSSSTVMFKAGDWIQPANSRYPYIIQEDLTRGSVSTRSTTVHRPLITSEATTVTGAFLVGTATTLRVVVAELPTYQLIQNNWAEFNGDFTLIEKVI